jgi:hypothetical protein
MTSWLFLPIMFTFMGIGLIMKYFQWPRPPMLLGIILGPIIEENLVSAESVYGWAGVATRPLTIALFIIAVATLIFFSRTGNKSPEPEVSIPAGGSQEADTEMVHLSFKDAVLQARNIPILLMIGGALAFIVASLDFAPGAQFFPIGAAAGIIILSLSQLYTHLVSQRTMSKVDIMDIGMKSAGMEGTRDAAIKLIAMLLLFVIIMGTIPTFTIFGLEVHSTQLATFSYAILSPYFWMSGKWRYIGPVIAVTAVAFFQFVIMDRFIFTIYPEAALFEWVGREIFGSGE